MDNSSSNLIVVDFDNTLFFTDACVKRASEKILGKKLDADSVRKLDKKIKRQIFDMAFLKYWKYSTPNKKMIKLLKSRTMPSQKIIILTARYSNMRNSTIRLLKRSGVPYTKVMFRKLKYQKSHDQEWKLLALREIIKKMNIDTVEFFEDKEENIRHISTRIKDINFEPFVVSRESIIPSSGNNLIYARPL